MIDHVFSDVTVAFTAPKVISTLAPSIRNEKPPLLQAVIRALTNTIKCASADELNSVIQTIKHPLFIVSGQNFTHRR